MAADPPDPDPRFLWLALLRAPELGPARIHTLLNTFGCPERIFGAGRERLRRAGVTWEDTLAYLEDPPRTPLLGDLEWLEQPDHHLLTIQDPDYPRLLAETVNPPPLLFVQGRTDVLHHHQIAMVGSRNPSPTGCDNAQAFARQLAASGFCITSGLALGIDAASHTGALAAGGTTIAVLGCGLDRIYPKQHARLARQITAQGALVSEFPPGTTPLPSHFPRRNRVISGLSLGTLVVEAALQSGSLITAHCAIEQGREVFAIPGSIHNPLAKGCHRLIREGAKLVDTVDHILEELGPLAGAFGDAPREPTALRIDPDTDQLLELVLRHIDYDPVAIDVLLRRTGMAVETVLSALTELELRERITALPGGCYQRLNKTRSMNEREHV